MPQLHRTIPRRVDFAPVTNSIELLMLPGAETELDLVSLARELAEPWRARAACRDHPELDWFPEFEGDAARAVKAVCAGCSVRVECLEYAMRTEHRGYRNGVWGGLSARERENRRRRRFS